MLGLEIATTMVNALHENLDDYSPFTVIAGTIAATLLLQKAYKIYENWDRRQIKKDLKDSTIRILTKLPYFGAGFRAQIDSGVNEMLDGIRVDIQKKRAEWTPIKELPATGWSVDAILARVKTVSKRYIPGSLSGAVYAEHDPILIGLLKNVWAQTAFTNPMHSEWPLLNLMEAEVISMCHQLVHGEPDSPGIMTAGGSFSIFEALRAYVCLARDTGIEKPEIIVPDSAHVAFDKAAQTLGVKLIKVPVDKKTGAADIKAMKNAITRRTCLMVGSAPSFPYGVMDPIEELAGIALQHDIPFHVDGCLGGFLSAFANEAGFPIPPCDFSVPGVTSISMDTHKYGQTPKGSSLLLYSKTCLATSTQVYLNWVGGMYVTPSMGGSRNGADIATTWATLCYKGRLEYVRETKAILSLQTELVSAIKGIDGLTIPYNPMLSVIPIQTTPGINVFIVAEHLAANGWSVNIIQGTEQQAAGFHFCLTSVHTKRPNFVKDFITDLSKAVQYAKDHPDAQPHGMTKAYGALAKGVPAFVQRRIGNGYVDILNTLGLLAPPAPQPLPSSAERMENSATMASPTSS